MSDYLANLAARSIAGIGLLRPRVAGVYEPPGLAANAWFGGRGSKEDSLGETTDKNNFDSSMNGAPADLPRTAEHDRGKFEDDGGLHDRPSPAALPSPHSRSEAEPPAIPHSPQHPLSLPETPAQETPVPEGRPEVHFPQNVRRSFPSKFDLVTFFQRNREESSELQTASSHGLQESEAKEQTISDFKEVRSAEVRAISKPHPVRGQAELLPHTVEGFLPNESGMDGRVSSGLPSSQKTLSNDLPHVQPPRATEIVQEAARALTRNEALLADGVPPVRERVRALAFSGAFGRAEISETRAEATKPEISKTASAESQPTRLQAIWRQPRPPVSLPHHTENAARHLHPHTDEHLAIASNPAVQVTIGRIEVRASVPQVGGSARERGMPKVMGLQEYLGNRAGRRGK